MSLEKSFDRVGPAAHFQTLAGKDHQGIADWVNTYAYEQPLCVSEHVKGTRACVYYSKGDPAFVALEFGTLDPEQTYVPLGNLPGSVSMSVVGTIDPISRHFVADDILDSELDLFERIETLQRYGFVTVSALCCSSIPDVITCATKYHWGRFGLSNTLNAQGLMVRVASHVARLENADQEPSGFFID